jgi:hypothetical protein
MQTWHFHHEHICCAVNDMATDAFTPKLFFNYCDVLVESGTQTFANNANADVAFSSQPHLRYK